VGKGVGEWHVKAMLTTCIQQGKIRIKTTQRKGIELNLLLCRWSRKG
jgi:hypothetical protein